MRSGSSSIAVLLAVTTCAVACRAGDTGDGAPSPTLAATSGEPCGEGTTYQSFAGPFLLNWCTGCHSSELGPGERQGAPVGVDFDTREGVLGREAELLLRVVDERTMPPAGGPSDDERALFEDWVRCGAPAESPYFDPAPPAHGPVPPEPDTRACAAPRAPLPAAILPRCAAATRSCRADCATSGLDGAGADACREACVQADTTPAASIVGYPVDCGACILYQLIACGEEVGCHDQVAALMCCFEECAQSGDPACDARCKGAIDAFGQCVYYRGERCLKDDGPYQGACFAP